jgi:membrane-associated protease RseP (regulator of RpoE activity)
MRPFALSLIATLGIGASLAAQNKCGSPGAPYGILTIQCNNCSFIRDESTGRTTIVYSTPPVAEKVASGSALMEGDIIEAVDSLSITSRAGVERFTSPVAGAHTVTVRRNGARQLVPVLVDVCRGTSSSSSSSSSSSASSRGDDGIHEGKGHGSGQGAGIGVSPLGGEALVISTQTTGASKDGTIQGAKVTTTTGARTDGKSDRIGRFGFATRCNPSCSAKPLPNGRYSLKYDGNPIVAVIRPGSVAEQAGLRVGDEIVTINGRSILADDALEGTATRDDLRLTVRREGKNLDVHMQLKP